MPIVVTLLDNSSAPGIVCSDQLIVRPGVVMHAGCEVFTKVPAYVISKGQEAVLEHQFRNSAGEPIDITDCLAEDGEGNSGQVIFRFYDASGMGDTIHQIVGSVEDLASGLVRSQITELLASKACIYNMEIALLNQSGDVVFTNKAMLMVERGLFGNTNSASLGPLTRDEVRLALRDVMQENDLLSDVDFDDIEIIHAILRPVMDWNEEPPQVVMYSSCSFPFREHWLRATCVHLLRTAAAWFERNKLLVSAGGVTANDREKAKDYLNIANMLQAEWRQWMRNTKMMMNIEQGYGSFYTGGY